MIVTSLRFGPLWHPSLPLLPTPVAVSDVGDVWLAAVDTLPSLAPVLHVVVGQLEHVGLLTPGIVVLVAVRGRVGPLCQVRYAHQLNSILLAFHNLGSVYRKVCFY